MTTFPPNIQALINEITDFGGTVTETDVRAGGSRFDVELPRRKVGGGTFMTNVGAIAFYVADGKRKWSTAKIRTTLDQYRKFAGISSMK